MNTAKRYECAKQIAEQMRDKWTAASRAKNQFSEDKTSDEYRRLVIDCKLFEESYKRFAVFVAREFRNQNISFVELTTA